MGILKYNNRIIKMGGQLIGVIKKIFGKFLTDNDGKKLTDNDGKKLVFDNE